MKALLINSNRFEYPAVIPIGLSCVASAVEKSGHVVKILDLFYSKSCEQSIAQTIAAFHPDIIGIGIRNIDNAAGHNTLFLLDRIRETIIRPCKTHFKGPIVIGGAAVGISGEEILKYFDLPYALQGEGEQSLVEFLDRYEKKIELSGIAGLIRQEDGKIIESTPPVFIKDLTPLPFCEDIFRHFDVKQYHKEHNAYLPIQTKRGCPFHCVYCTYNRIEGKIFRLRDPKQVADEIERLFLQTRINSFEFSDSVFNFPLDHTKAVLRAIVQKKLNIRFRSIGLHPGAVDEELIDLMKEAGFTETELSAEAGCDAALKGLGKNFTKEDIHRAVFLLHGKGIHINWFLLIGGPGETRETLEETFKTIRREAAPWDMVTIGIGLRVYNGAPIASILKATHPDCTRDDFLLPVSYPPKGIRLEEALEITRKHALLNTNYLVYNAIGTGKTVPSWGLAFGRFAWKTSNTLLKILTPNRPSWQTYILFRKMANATHFRKKVNALRAELHDLSRQPEA